MLLPLTVAVPTVVPPVVQLVGALVCGPKTVKVMVPVGLSPLARVPVIELAAIAVPAEPVLGAVAESVGEAFATTVSDMPEPHVLTAALSFVSPAYDAYHQ